MKSFRAVTCSSFPICLPYLQRPVNERSIGLGPHWCVHADVTVTDRMLNTTHISNLCIRWLVGRVKLVIVTALLVELPVSPVI